MREEQEQETEDNHGKVEPSIERSECSRGSSWTSSSVDAGHHTMGRKLQRRSMSLCRSTSPEATVIESRRASLDLKFDKFDEITAVEEVEVAPRQNLLHKLHFHGHLLPSRHHGHSQQQAPETPQTSPSKVSINRTCLYQVPTFI